jgi:transcriptional regulator with XRE-family HTH domain
MKRHSYGERDFAFGQRVLTLRTHIGVTQQGLARLLHVGRKAVGGWEAGANYPKVDSLKALIALAMQQRAFPAGREEEEIRALWQAAHQKALLDEQWLSSLLGRAPTSLPPVSLPEQSIAPARETFRSQVDWGEAVDPTHFYGREQELATLSHWILEERCRLVSVLGMGGIGKSTLAVRAAQRLAGHFEVVLFRSLRDAPACSALLESCLQVLSPQALTRLREGLEPRLSRLMQELREQRVLLVLDNLEILLQGGDLKGRMRPGFEDYDLLLRRVAETGHQSCLLLTSRERLPILRGLEGRQAPVHSLHLEGLDTAAGRQLLAAH